MRNWLQRLDVYGGSDPDFNELQLEDICPVCDRRVVDHPGRERDGLGDRSAKWAHRRAALSEIVFNRWGL